MKKLSLILSLALFAMAGFAQNAVKLKNYVGTYRIDGGPIYEVNVAIKDGNLYGSSDQGEASLKPTEMMDTFEIEGYEGMVKFNRDGGIVKSMTMTIQGQEMMGVRKMPPSSDFPGIYSFENAPFEKMTVTSEDGVVYVEVADIGKGALEFTSNLDEFYEPNYGSSITFGRGATGVVEKIVVLAQGAELVGTKEVVSSMNEYAGTFTFDAAPFNELIVTVQADKLHGNAVGQGEADMLQTTQKDEFEIQGYDGFAKFIRDASGQITGVSLSIQGSEMQGKKQIK